MVYQLRSAEPFDATYEPWEQKKACLHLQALMYQLKR